MPITVPVAGSAGAAKSYVPSAPSVIGYVRSSPVARSRAQRASEPSAALPGATRSYPLQASAVET
ncbi:hypothetical protein ABZ747_30875 [Kitasatospora cineracea]|uniref:hypothetical protein n=1 Tax=Kitasatospora cineracea TaxID=88074 RepID=UPI0033DC63C5